MTDLIERLQKLRDENSKLRAALRPFAEMPPHSPPSRRLLVADAGTGPYHFLQSDLDQAKEVYRALEQKAPVSDGQSAPKSVI